jgi:hypothetical protein
LQERYLALRGELKPVGYSPESQAKRPPGERDQYKAIEVPEHLEGQVDGKAVRLDYRMVFVSSESKARQEASTRERHTATVVAEFEAVQRDLGRSSLKTTEAVVRRLEAAKGKYAEGVLPDYRLVQGPGGRFLLTWEFDAGALERSRHLEGAYVLKTDLPERTHPRAEVMRCYKGRSQVERRFHHLKVPLAVAPMFLKNPERIAGLLCVLVWALMVLAVMERQVRRELKGELKGEPLYGLYPEGRPRPAPTGPSLVQALSGLSIVIVHQDGTVARRLAQPDPAQRRIIPLLGINSERLQTFKRTCGM